MQGIFRDMILTRSSVIFPNRLSWWISRNKKVMPVNLFYER
jgi:hypothetical protein